jgi:hypothetical protein
MFVIRYADTGRKRKELIDKKIEITVISIKNIFDIMG